TYRRFQTIHQVFAHDRVILDDHMPVRVRVVRLPGSAASFPPLLGVSAGSWVSVIDDRDIASQSLLDPLGALAPDRVSHDRGRESHVFRLQCRSDDASSVAHSGAVSQATRMHDLKRAPITRNLDMRGLAENPNRPIALTRDFDCR